VWYISWGPGMSEYYVCEVIYLIYVRG
jgi:hypothetical protein